MDKPITPSPLVFCNRYLDMCGNEERPYFGAPVRSSFEPAPHYGK